MPGYLKIYYVAHHEDNNFQYRKSDDDFTHWLIKYAVGNQIQYVAVDNGTNLENFIGIYKKRDTKTTYTQKINIQFFGKETTLKDFFSSEDELANHLKNIRAKEKLAIYELHLPEALWLDLKNKKHPFSPSFINSFESNMIYALHFFNDSEVPKAVYNQHAIKDACYPIFEIKKESWQVSLSKPLPFEVKELFRAMQKDDTFAYQAASAKTQPAFLTQTDSLDQKPLILYPILTGKEKIARALLTSQAPEILEYRYGNSHQQLWLHALLCNHHDMALAYFKFAKDIQFIDLLKACSLEAIIEQLDYFTELFSRINKIFSLNSTQHDNVGEYTCLLSLPFHNPSACGILVAALLKSGFDSTKSVASLYIGNGKAIQRRVLTLQTLLFDRFSKDQYENFFISYQKACQQLEMPPILLSTPAKTEPKIIPAVHTQISPLIVKQQSNESEKMQQHKNAEIDMLKIEEDYTCPITLELPQDPVSLKNDPTHVYERRALIEWVLSDKGECTKNPYTKVEEPELVALYDALKKENIVNCNKEAIEMSKDFLKTNDQAKEKISLIELGKKHPHSLDNTTSFTLSDYYSSNEYAVAVFFNEIATLWKSLNLGPVHVFTGPVAYGRDVNPLLSQSMGAFFTRLGLTETDSQCSTQFPSLLRAMQMKGMTGFLSQKNIPTYFWQGSSGETNGHRENELVLGYGEPGHYAIRSNIDPKTIEGSDEYLKHILESMVKRIQKAHKINREYGTHVPDHALYGLKKITAAILVEGGMDFMDKLYHLSTTKIKKWIGPIGPYLENEKRAILEGKRLTELALILNPNIHQKRKAFEQFEKDLISLHNEGGYISSIVDEEKNQIWKRILNNAQLIFPDFKPTELELLLRGKENGYAQMSESRPIPKWIIQKINADPKQIYKIILRRIPYYATGGRMFCIADYEKISDQVYASPGNHNYRMEIDAHKPDDPNTRMPYLNLPMNYEEWIKHKETGNWKSLFPAQEELRIVGKNGGQHVYANRDTCSHAAFKVQISRWNQLRQMQHWFKKEANSPDLFSEIYDTTKRQLSMLADGILPPDDPKRATQPKIFTIPMVLTILNYKHMRDRVEDILFADENNHWLGNKKLRTELDKIPLHASQRDNFVNANTLDKVMLKKLEPADMDKNDMAKRMYTYFQERMQYAVTRRDDEKNKSNKKITEHCNQQIALYFDLLRLYQLKPHLANPEKLIEIINTHQNSSIPKAKIIEIVNKLREIAKYHCPYQKTNFAKYSDQPDKELFQGGYFGEQSTMPVHNTVPVLYGILQLLLDHTENEVFIQSQIEDEEAIATFMKNIQPQFERLANLLRGLMTTLFKTEETQASNLGLLTLTRITPNAINVTDAQGKVTSVSETPQAFQKLVDDHFPTSFKKEKITTPFHFQDVILGIIKTLQLQIRGLSEKIDFSLSYSEQANTVILDQRQANPANDIQHAQLKVSGRKN